MIVVTGRVRIGVADRPAGKHPDRGHEAGVGIALDEQHLERAVHVLAATAQQDHRGGRSRGRGLAGHCLNLARAAAVACARHAMEASTKQLWMCTSCGFIYDPDEGDPDGGIPPGTNFDDIPDSWFCPVCGARKADFEPYDE